MPKNAAAGLAGSVLQTVLALELDLLLEKLRISGIFIPIFSFQFEISEIADLCWEGRQGWPELWVRMWAVSFVPLRSASAVVPSFIAEGPSSWLESPAVKAGRIQCILEGHTTVLMGLGITLGQCLNCCTIQPVCDAISSPVPSGLEARVLDCSKRPKFNKNG